MNKFNGFLKDFFKAIMLIWMITVSVITIDQAAASMTSWDKVFDVEFGRD